MSTDKPKFTSADIAETIAMLKEAQQRASPKREEITDQHIMNVAADVCSVMIRTASEHPKMTPLEVLSGVQLAHMAVVQLFTGGRFTFEDYKTLSESLWEHATKMRAQILDKQE